MKKFYSFTMLYLVLMIVFSTTILAQDNKNIPQKETTPQRAAEGQTKWITSALKLDKSTYQELYNVFLKYQLQIESVRKSRADYADKKNLFLEISQNQDKDLKSILSQVDYNKYVAIVSDIKSKAAPK